MIDRYINLLLNNGIILQSEEEVYRYKVTCLVEKIFSTSMMLLVSLIFKQFTVMVIFIVCFFALRNRTGGFHLDSFGSCFVGTMGIEVVVIFFIKSHVIPLIVSGVVSTVAAVIILILGGANHPNMDYDKEEYSFNKKYARLLVIIEFSVIAFLSWIQVPGVYIQAVEYSVILTAILLIMAFTMGQHKRIE